MSGSGRTVEQRCAADPNFVAWVGERPACVRALATEFPMGRLIEVPERGACYVVGWTEDDMVVFSPIWLGHDYEAGMEARFHVCASHLREWGL